MLSYAIFAAIDCRFSLMPPPLPPATLLRQAGAIAALPLLMPLFLRATAFAARFHFRCFRRFLRLSSFMLSFFLFRLRRDISITFFLLRFDAILRFFIIDCSIIADCRHYAAITPALFFAAFRHAAIAPLLLSIFADAITLTIAFRH